MDKNKSYWRDGIDQVEGWLEKGIELLLQAIKDFQQINKIRGSVLEIGVHHGKFFIPLLNLTRDNEFAVGIDIFDSQELNIDKSGCGNYKVCLENIKKFSTYGDRAILIEKDSLAINVKERVELVEKYGPFRIVSVDGGHTPTHTVNDLLIAQDILQSGGVVIVDDYYNMHWPGVHEGVARFFFQKTPKIRIFCYTQNKLFLTDLSYYRRYLSFFQERFADFPDYKKVRMWDSEAIVFRNK